MEGHPLPADEGPPGAAEVLVPLAREGRVPGRLLIFLFADIRGFTAFTGRHGAAAAAALADAFVTLGRETAQRHGGELSGTWGDQVLIEFASPRDALRAGVHLLGRCREATLAHPDRPLPAGAGLDVGEPAEEGSHRSAPALNVAARLCARAEPGEVLATRELVHLAGAVDGLAYVDRGAVRLKGVAEPTRVVRVRPVADDRDAERRFQALVTESRRLRQDPRAWVAVLVSLALVAVLGGWAVGRLGEHEAVQVPAGGVAIVDGASGRVVDAAVVGGDPEGMVRADGGVWVAQAASGSVVLIAPDSGQIRQTVQVGRTPVALASTGHDLWAVNSRDSSVTRISTTTRKVLQQRIPVGIQPIAIAAGFDSVWVANEGAASVTRIDARSGKVVGTAVVGRGPDGVAVGRGLVWVSNGRDGTVSPVDPQTMLAGAAIRVGAGPKGIAVAPSGIWVANRLESTVSRIDPTRGQETDRVNVGDAPFAVLADRTSVWVTVGATGSLVRIDAGRRVPGTTVRLGASPYGLALVGGKIWASTRPFAAARHFGGTLTMVTDGITETLDPAITNEQIPGQFLAAVYDGLVGYRRAGGLDNYDPVPDLAVALPGSRDGGRTYTFRVRPGIRYSDGRTVVPADFRRGFERMFTATRSRKGSGNAVYFTRIVGGEACLVSPRPCDLSRGIVTDASTVTFHLTEADPDFQYKLALPFAAPAPPGTTTSTAPLGTGPYAVAAFTPERRLRLVRNRYFHSWSASARPRGYPEALQWRSVPTDQMVPEISSGRADLTYLDFAPPAAAEEVALRRPAQVRQDALAFTAFLLLDTNSGPFAHVDARRALSMALDRRRFVDTFGLGPELITCTAPPPGFPGYEPYCPSTRGPRPSTAWRGPDLAEAKRLVDRSGTRGATVRIFWSGGQFTPGQGRYVAGLLRTLGYDVRFHLAESYSDGQPPAGAHFDMFNNGFYADFPTATAYYAPCPAPTGTGDEREGYCNPALDAVAARALRLGEADPGRSDQLWREYYRHLADQVPSVPIRNGTRSVYVSSRVGNYQFGAFEGPLLDQMWVR